MISLEKIGPYKIEREIGRGGMATVYLAQDNRANRQVVVKVLPPQFTHDPRFRGRFKREAEVVAQLNHPNIVPVYDYGEDGDTPYLVMGYMAGGTLAERIKQGPLSAKESTEILSTIAPALDFAHEKGIVHRDMKPDNILFDEQGQAYLSDFGIVKLADTSQSFTGSAVVGTPAYMSPEQVRGGNIDGRSDVYSLGIVLYEMLTGEVPFKGDTPTQQLMKHVLEPVPQILNILPDLPPHRAAVVTKALAKKPADRFPSASDMISALSGVNVTLSPASTPVTIPTQEMLPSSQPAQTDVFTPVYEPPASKVPSGQSRSRTWLPAGRLVGVLLVAVVAVLGALYLFTDGEIVASLLPDTATLTPSLTAASENAIEEANDRQVMREAQLASDATAGYLFGYDLYRIPTSSGDDSKIYILQVAFQNVSDDIRVAPVIPVSDAWVETKGGERYPVELSRFTTVISTEGELFDSYLNEESSIWPGCSSEDSVLLAPSAIIRNTRCEFDLRADTFEFVNWTFLFSIPVGADLQSLNLPGTSAIDLRNVPTLREFQFSAPETPEFPSDIGNDENIRAAIRNAHLIQDYNLRRKLAVNLEFTNQHLTSEQTIQAYLYIVDSYGTLSSVPARCDEQDKEYPFLWPILQIGPDQEIHHRSCVFLWNPLWNPNDINSDVALWVWKTNSRLDPSELGLDPNSVMNVRGVRATFEPLREGVLTSDDTRLVWVGNRRLGRIEIQERNSISQDKSTKLSNLYFITLSTAGNAYGRSFQLAE